MFEYEYEFCAKIYNNKKNVFKICVKVYKIGQIFQKYIFLKIFDIFEIKNQNFAAKIYIYIYIFFENVLIFKICQKVRNFLDKFYEKLCNKNKLFLDNIQIYLENPCTPKTCLKMCKICNVFLNFRHF